MWPSPLALSTSKSQLVDAGEHNFGRSFLNNICRLNIRTERNRVVVGLSPTVLDEHIAQELQAVVEERHQVPRTLLAVSVDGRGRGDSDLV